MVDKKTMEEIEEEIKFCEIAVTSKSRLELVIDTLKEVLMRLREAVKAETDPKVVDKVLKYMEKARVLNGKAKSLLRDMERSGRYRKVEESS